MRSAAGADAVQRFAQSQILEFNESMAARLTRNGWTRWHLVGAVLMVTLAVLSRRAAWGDILRIATRDEESSHIFLVPFVFVWLVWVRRFRLRNTRPHGKWWGLLVLGAGAILSFWGYERSIHFFWHAGSVLVAVGALLVIVGTDILLSFLPAFGVLIFLVPVPGMVREQIAIPLQTYTAVITQQLFEVLGVAVERSGNLLSINGVDVTIAEACNGVRMAFALTLVSWAFAFGTPLRGYARGLVLAASPITAIGCNVMRIAFVLWFYGEQFSWAGAVHDISGWLMLGLSFLLLYSILAVLRWALVPVEAFTLAKD